jgi:hypothetical protein
MGRMPAGFTFIRLVIERKRGLDRRRRGRRLRLRALNLSAEAEVVIVRHLFTPFGHFVLTPRPSSTAAQPGFFASQSFFFGVPPFLTVARAGGRGRSAQIRRRDRGWPGPGTSSSPANYSCDVQGRGYSRWGVDRPGPGVVLRHRGLSRRLPRRLDQGPALFPRRWAENDRRPVLSC